MREYETYTKNCSVLCKVNGVDNTLGKLSIKEITELYRKLLNRKRFNNLKNTHIEQLKAIEGIMEYRRDQCISRRLDERLRNNEHVYKRAERTADCIIKWLEKAYK